VGEPRGAISPGRPEGTHEVEGVERVGALLQTDRGRREVHGDGHSHAGAHSIGQSRTLSAESQQRKAGAEREADDGHPARVSGRVVESEQEVAGEAGIVEVMSDGTSVGGSSHVQAQDVPAAGVGEEPSGKHVGRPVVPSKPMDEDEGGRSSPRAWLP